MQVLLSHRRPIWTVTGLRNCWWALRITTPVQKTTEPSIYCPGGNLAQADAADGKADGAVELEQAAALPGNWKFVYPGFDWDRFGRNVSPASDLNGDNVGDLIVGGYSARIVSGADLNAADSADGAGRRRDQPAVCLTAFVAVGSDFA